MTEKRADKIHWHSGFQGAVELEFRENKEDLVFDREHYLSKEPIRMDMLIIKVVKGAKIKNEIGHIFKGYNVIEYKSPDDSTNIDDLFKTIGYACLYKGLGGSVDAIPAEELTVSLWREKNPKEFFKALDKIGATVERKFQGVYYIKGITMLDTQLVVFEELDEKTHSSLRILSKKASEDDVRTFLENTENLVAPCDKENMNAVLEVSIEANRELYQKLKEEFNMCEALRDLMKDEIDEAVNLRVTKAVNEAVKEAVSEAVTNAQKETKLNATVDFVKALMESSNIEANEAMSRLKIPANEWDSLKQKL